jgi:hypothetical protein
VANIRNSTSVHEGRRRFILWLPVGTIPDHGTHQPYLTGCMFEESLMSQATCSKRRRSMGMAVQPLYGDRALGLVGDWAGRDERNFGPCYLTRRRAITSPTMCRTAVAQLSFTVPNQHFVPVPKPTEFDCSHNPLCRGY